MKKGRSNRERKAFTLLEVILALAILAGSTAVLGELIRSGLRNADEARDLTRGQMICESVVSQVLAGAISASSTSSVQFEDDPRWLYSITVDSTQMNGLILVQVSAVRDVPAQQHPVQYTLIRWMIDPSVAPETTVASAQVTQGTGQSSTQGNSISQGRSNTGRSP